MKITAKLISDMKIKVQKFYAKKDKMHNFNHINNLIKKSILIGKGKKYDKNLLKLSALFHGLIPKKEKEVQIFLKKEMFDKELNKKIINIAYESLKHSKPKTIEGKILHDAHLLEGSIYSPIIKSLITSQENNQTIKDCAKYVKKNILGKYNCSFEENKLIYKKREKIMKDFFQEIEKNN